MLFIILNNSIFVCFLIAYQGILGDTITFISDINLHMVYVLQVKNNYCFEFFDVFQKYDGNLETKKIII
jgi:hypothetical protein